MNTSRFLAAIVLSSLLVTLSASTSTAGYAYWTGDWKNWTDSDVWLASGTEIAMGAYYEDFSGGQGMVWQTEIVERTFRVIGDTDVNLQLIGKLEVWGEYWRGSEFPGSMTNAESWANATVGVYSPWTEALYLTSYSHVFPPPVSEGPYYAYEETAAFLSLPPGDYTFSIQLESYIMRDGGRGDPRFSTISSALEVEIVGIASVVPEPSSLALSLIGLAGAGALAARRCGRKRPA